MSPDHSSETPLRILYLSWRDRENPEAGGSEIFVERTSEVMTDLGDDVTIFTARFPGAAKHTKHGEVNVIRRGNRFTCYPAGLWHILRHRDDYDVIIDVQNGVPFWSPLMAKIPVILVVHHVHHEQWNAIFGSAIAKFGWFLESKAAPWVYRGCRYVTVSKATREELGALGIPAERVDIVYSGNDQPDDLERYASIPRSQAPSISVLGRLVPHKQVEIALDTIAALRDEHPGIHLNIIGTGYWEDNIRAHAESLGISDAVHFHGFVDEATKHKLLASSWLVMMPSYREGWGLTIVEAGLHGTPALAFTSSGGPSESIQHGLTGALAHTTSELIETVRFLLERDDVRTHLGEAAKIHSRSFSWESAGRQLHHTVRSVLGLQARAAQPPSSALDVQPLRELFSAAPAEQR